MEKFNLFPSNPGAQRISGHPESEDHFIQYKNIPMK